jgi:hypothetical protein
VSVFWYTQKELKLKGFGRRDSHLGVYFVFFSSKKNKEKQIEGSASSQKISFSPTIGLYIESGFTLSLPEPSPTEGKDQTSDAPEAQPVASDAPPAQPIPTVQVKSERIHGEKEA